MRIGPLLAVVVVLLGLIAVAVNRFGSTGLSRETATAMVRATVQLAVLAAILGAVIGNIWATMGFVAVMAAVAAWVSSGRVVSGRGTVAGCLRCLLPVAAPTIAIVVLLVLLGVLPATGLAIIPTAGIMFGGAMNTASLAGRRARDELRTRRGEVDAALSLGFVPRDARMEISRTAAASALIPGLDQTRSAGLVTIPGSFVGMVLGGATTTAAAIMQIFVLAALLAVSSIAMVVTAELVALDVL